MGRMGSGLTFVHVLRTRRQHEKVIDRPDWSVPHRQPSEMLSPAMLPQSGEVPLDAELEQMLTALGAEA